MTSKLYLSIILIGLFFGLFDIYGKLVKQMALSGKGFYNEISIPIIDLAVGVYNYQLKSNCNIQNPTGKIAILK